MKKFTPQEKLDILLRLIAGEATANELCEKYGVRSAKTLYNWRTRLLGSAESIFSERRGAPPRNPSKLPPPGDISDDEYLPRAPGVESAFSEDESDKELQDLFGVNELELRRKVRRRLTPRTRSKRGRKTLQRTVRLTHLPRKRPRREVVKR
jgi:transposase-like protein